jgi:hypothetical protein
MSQMNVFQKLGHPYIPFHYIRQIGCAAWQKDSDKIEWQARHEPTWWKTTVFLQAMLVIPYLHIPYIYRRKIWPLWSPCIPMQQWGATHLCTSYKSRSPKDKSHLVRAFVEQRHYSIMHRLLLCVLFAIAVSAGKLQAAPKRWSWPQGQRTIQISNSTRGMYAYYRAGWI